MIASHLELLLEPKINRENNGLRCNSTCRGIGFPFLSLFGAGPLKNVIRAVTLIAIVVLCCVGQPVVTSDLIFEKSFTLGDLFG